MKWKRYLFLIWFLEFFIIAGCYILDPFFAIVSLIFLTPVSIASTFIILTEFRGMSDG